MDAILPLYFWVLPFVFLTGVVDAAAGGGGLISLPAYLAVGLPPHAAIATNKCSSVFGTMVAAFRYMKRGHVHYPTAIAATLTALPGSFLGAQLSLHMDSRILSILLMIIIPGVALLLAFRRNVGAPSDIPPATSVGKICIAATIGLTVGAYDGFFGPGTGTFLTLLFAWLCKMDLITAGGNTKIVNLASNIAAFVTFAFSGQVVWQVGIPAAVCGILGNYLGAGLALKKGGAFIRPMLYLVLTILLIKIVADFFCAS